MLNKIIALTRGNIDPLLIECYETVRRNPCFIGNHRELISTLGAQIRAIQSKTPT